MRTNIELDDKIIADAMRLSKSRTKKETIHKALQAYTRLLKRRKILELKGKVDWQGDIDEMRKM
jgi:Arc/MetJ family transcription regulator